MFFKLITECKLRNRHCNKVTEIELKKRKAFIESLENTFWVISPEHEKILQESGHEDWSYLECVRGKNYGATIAAFDSQLYKKKEEKIIF